MNYRRSDRLAEFSHLLAQIKFIILEIVIFIGFLLWLWDKVKHDFQLSSAARPTIEISEPCPTATVQFVVRRKITEK